MARKLVVEIIGDASSLEKSYAKASKSTKAFGRDMNQAGRGTVAGSGAFQSLGRSVAFASGTFLGAAGFTVALKSSITAASDLHEQMSKTEVVFGESAAGIKAWSKTTADAFGLSRRQALATASSFGALFAPLGIIGKTAADQSRRLTELGADLASFYNTDVQDALDAIQSGLVGESEPLRRYGVLLSETRVQQEAMAETGKKNAKSLTNQEKALARIRIIFRDTAKAQGDFSRTSDGLANQSRELKANVDDLQASLGERLTPKISNAARAAKLLLDDLDGLTKSKPVVVGGVGSLEQNRKLVDQFLTLKDILKVQKELDRAGRGLQGPVGKPAKPFAAPGMQGPTKADVEAVKRSAAQRNEWFDAAIGRRLDRASELPLKQQLAALTRIGKDISARIKVTKDITRKLNLEDQLRQVVAGQKDVKAQLAQQFLDGLQLNVDRTALTATLTDDVAALNAQLAGIRKRIQIEGPTNDLLQAELAVQLRRKDLLAEQAQAAKDAEKARRDAVSAALQLRVDRAALTTTLNDDLAAVNAQLAGIRQRMQAEGRTNELLQAELAVLLRRKDLLQQQAQARRDAAAAAKQASEAALQTKLDWAQFALERAQTTKGVQDDIKALRTIIAIIQKQIRLTGRTVALARALWEARRQLKEAIRGPDDSSGGGGGGGLTNRRREGGRVPSIGFQPPPPVPQTVVPPPPSVAPPSGAGGGHVTINGGVHLHGVQDVGEMEHQIQKRAMARPQTRRGPV